MPNITRGEYEQLTDRLVKLGFEISMRTPRHQDNGYWNSNDNITIVVTLVGVVYTRKKEPNDSDTINIIQQLCPKGRIEIDFMSPGLRDLFCPEEIECVGTNIR